MDLFGADQSGEPMNLVSSFMEEVDCRVIKEHPELELVMLQMLLWRYLYDVLLHDQIIFPGLDQNTEACLGRVVSGLGALKPAKGDDAPSLFCSSADQE